MYTTIKGELFDIKVWNKDVPMESGVFDQVRNLAKVNGVQAVSLMPDAHVGRGSTVGSVIVTKDVIIPATVGVDIGCGMNAIRLSLKADQLPDSLGELRHEIEKMIPVGFDQHTDQRTGIKDRQMTRQMIRAYMKQMDNGLNNIVGKHPDLNKMTKDLYKKAFEQVGTLGGGNHFVELCIDENQDVWIMLHSGSRGIGNVIGRYFIEKAKEEMIRLDARVPEKDLSYLSVGTGLYNDYVESVDWAQGYAANNRRAMMELVLIALKRHLPEFEITQEAINCHHNYISKEVHMDEEVYVTRKGAVSAQAGELGIIPGSMGAKSYIVRGKGSADAFCSCSHGAGRVMSRGAAKRAITLEDHVAATEGVECRKDRGVLDESPAAYKDIDAVMSSQTDLVEVVHQLKQVLCVKG